jgi:hypothetical protein
MLRLNMAVPPTQRNDPAFSSLGLVQAAVLGLLDPAYANTSIQNIPNMDGFPNGRRLEDDVTRIELQAVGGIALAAIGLWYDDYTVGGSPVTPQLLNVLNYTTGVEKNDTTFKSSFPYVQTPWAGTHICDCDDDAGKNATSAMRNINSTARVYEKLSVAAPEMMATTGPNPFTDNSTIRYHLDKDATVTISVVDVKGTQVKMLVNKKLKAGTYTENWNGGNLIKGVYFINVSKNGVLKQSLRVVKG